KIDHLRDAQRINLDPLAALPVAAALGDLTDVDFRIEVGRECLSVTASIAVDDVDGVNLVEKLVLGVRAIRVHHPGIEAAAENAEDPPGSEAIVIRPLPRVTELR